jgi:nitrite reductase (NADH) small subunit
MNQKNLLNPDWVSIGHLQDIAPLGCRRVKRPQGVKGGEVAVFRAEGDRIYAVLDACPHKGGPLSQGLVFGARVACPLHNWTFDLSSGQVQSPDQGCVQTFSVKVENEEIFLDRNELMNPDAFLQVH